MSGRVVRSAKTAAIAVWFSTSAFAPAQAGDILRTSGGLSSTPAGSAVASPRDCQFGTIPTPLPLREAVERALCNDPKTREAWADTKAQAAAVGVARAHYLPTLSGEVQGVQDDSTTNVLNHPELSSHTLAAVGSGSVSLGWTLFDFGARRASLDNAQALLAAALANQNAALQTSFQAVTKDYYAAQAASGAFMAAEEIARMSQDSLAAAKARVDHAVAPISDALQAETARDQAVINVSKMRGAMQAAIGALAADMDLRPDTPLSLPAVSRGIEPDAGFDHAVGELIEAVRNQYPAVVAAEAQLKAARAKVAQTKAEGRPNVGLVAKYSANNQPASLGLGIPEYPARGEDAYVGVQVSIPLFEGFGRTYQVRQAQADAEHQQDVVEEARQHAGLEVWNDFQTLQSSTEIAQGAAKLLAAAQQSFDAARGRYVEGVGNVLELLSAQMALANAKQQHIQALTDWRASRLRLAGSLGDLQVDGSFR